MIVILIVIVIEYVYVNVNVWESALPRNADPVR